MPDHTIPCAHREHCRDCGAIYDARLLDDVVFHFHNESPGVDASVVGVRVDAARTAVAQPETET